MVLDGNVVLTKTYGKGELNKAYVYASISKVVTGMINHKYISQDMLYNRVIKRKKGSGWIIWPVRNAGTPDVELLASGSNGIPQAFMIIKLEKKLAAVVLAHTRDKKSFELVRLAQDIFSILERNAYNKN